MARGGHPDQGLHLQSTCLPKRNLPTPLPKRARSLVHQLLTLTLKTPLLARWVHLFCDGCFGFSCLYHCYLDNMSLQTPQRPTCTMNHYPLIADLTDLSANPGLNEHLPHLKWVVLCFVSFLLCWCVKDIQGCCHDLCWQPPFLDWRRSQNCPWSFCLQDASCVCLSYSLLRCLANNNII